MARDACVVQQACADDIASERTDGLLSLGIRLLFFLVTVALAALILDVFVVDVHGLIDLGAESAVVIDTTASLAIADSSYTESWLTYRLTNSWLSISSSIPVIFPASSGCNA